MLLRIGINVGDVIVKDQDIFGDGVNLAARLQDLAVAGGICISRSVRDQLRDKSPFMFEDQGEQSVKNIARPVRVFAVRFEGQPKVDTLVAEALHSGTESEETPIMTDDAELAFWDSITNSDAAADTVHTSNDIQRGTSVHWPALDSLPWRRATASGNNDEVKLEITYWESVAASDDRAMFRSYIDKYPDGHFKALAVTGLAKLTWDSELEDPES